MKILLRVSVSPWFKNLLRALRLLGVLFLLVTCSKPPPPASTSEVRVVIFHTADLHGRVHRLPALAGYLKGERAKERRRGARVVTVDGGDFFQGTPEGDLTRGRLVIQAMNEIGYDAACLGNHDFDFGPAGVRDLAARARFPLLCSNVFESSTGAPPPYVKDAVTLPEACLELRGLTVAAPRAGEELAFLDASSALARRSWTPGMARVLLSHLGIERDRRLPGIDLAAVLGGHSHTRAIEERAGGFPIVHPGSHGLSVGRLELVLNVATGDVRSFKANLIDLRTWRGPEDARVRALVRRGARRIAKLMEEPIGTLSVGLSREHAADEGASSPLGNWACDALKAALNADIALLPRSSLRASLFAGPVTRGDVYEAFPFPDTAQWVDMGGRDLRGVLERAIGDGGRPLLDVAGLEVHYSPSARASRRILEIRAGTETLRNDRRYRVATTSFLIETWLGAPPGEGTRILRDVLAEHLGRNSPLRVEYRNRIFRKVE
ncbi:MAG: bifunctional metallophosphatase/5'-nucleotidase [Planctomycetes bacterium]|nr:bifunctional metallophosphatase/5'-nucleotidase [Planctomycetota bacterium]